MYTAKVQKNQHLKQNIFHNEINDLFTNTFPNSMILNNKLSFHNDKRCIYKYISNSNSNIVWSGS